MHGSTAALVDQLVRTLIDRGVRVEKVDISTVDLGRLATLLVDAATMVVATPTVLTNVHPAMIGILYLANTLRPKVKYLSAMVTYGWASNAIDTITSMTSGLKAELIPPVLVRGLPGAKELEEVDRLAATIAGKHAEAGLLP
jgi:flavorubredoxin